MLDIQFLPLSEDNNITLMATTKDGKIIEGESEITECPSVIDHIFYKEEPKVIDEVLEAIKKC